MDNNDFNKIVTESIDSIQLVLVNKAKEYASEGDRLVNFKDGARITGLTPEMTLWAYMAKHLASIKKIIDDMNKGDLPTNELLDEKIGDAINYLILLKATIKEQLPEWKIPVFSTKKI
jgi:hypothetical protein